MVQALSFLTPSLHPNTLTDITLPLPSSSSSTPKDAIVKHLAVKHGSHQPIGLVKHMIATSEDSHHVLVADDQYRLSHIELKEDAPPEVLEQYTSPSSKNATWAGLGAIKAGTIATLSSGHTTLLPLTSSEGAGPSTTRLPSPITSVGASPSGASFAVAGNEVDLTILNVERAFASPFTAVPGRWKDTTLPGETWRGKNLPMSALKLRPPIHHLCLSYLPGHEDLLVTGTKAGSVRRYDTRQRKPVADWHVALEGGVGCVLPGRAEHELLFSDRAALTASLDLRTGKVLFTFPAAPTTHHLVPVPPRPREAEGSRRTVAASLSSDATLRVYDATPPPATAGGKLLGEGKKGIVAGSVGGVGIGSFVVRGWTDLPDDKEGEDGAGDAELDADAGNEEDDEEEDGDMWEGMDEVEDDEESSDEEAEVQPKKRRKGQA